MPKDTATTARGAEAFAAHYRSVLGDRYAPVRDALLARTPPVLRFDRRHEEALHRSWHSAGLPWETLPWYPFALRWPEGVPLGTELPGRSEHLFYPMNASSLVAPLELRSEDADAVLDACAAPGGKTLMLSDVMRGRGRLVANDPSPGRRRRLAVTLAAHGHRSVEAWGMRAETLFRRTPDRFDRILADTPCSSEKHVLGSPAHLSRWSASRIRRLRQQQIAILSGLFLALRPGGRMVYSTCALAPEENESVVAAIIAKKSGRIRLVRPDPALPGTDGLPGFAVDPRLVRRIWPDGGLYDPMFVAVFERTV